MPAVLVPGDPGDAGEQQGGAVQPGSDRRDEGTSGSPVFDHEGFIVAVSFAGIGAVVVEHERWLSTAKKKGGLSAGRNSYEELITGAPRGPGGEAGRMDRRRRPWPGSLGGTEPAGGGYRWGSHMVDPDLVWLVAVTLAVWLPMAGVAIARRKHPLQKPLEWGRHQPRKERVATGEDL